MGWMRPKVSSRWPSYDGGSEGTAMRSSPPERGGSCARAHGPGAVSTTLPRASASSTRCHHRLESRCIVTSTDSHTETGRPMAWLHFAELGHHLLALGERQWTPWMEDAAWRRMHGTWHLPPQ